MIGGMGSAVVPDLSQGGEIDGDLVVTGDFKVEGAGSFAFDEIVEGTMQIIGDLSLAGHLVPGAENTYDLGTTNAQDWRTLFIRKIDMQNELLTIVGANIAATYKDHSSVGNGHIFYHRNNEAMRIGVSGSADLTTTFTSSSANGSGTITGLHLKNSGTTVNDGTKLLFTSGTSTIGASIYNEGKALDSSDLVFEAGGSTERMRITRTGQVGIANTNPSAYSGSADDLVVGTSGHTGITIVSGTSSEGQLFFADGTSGDTRFRGGVQYNHSNDFLSLIAGGLTNDSTVNIKAGSLGIGTISPQTKLHISTGADTGEYFRGGGSTNSADARVLKITASTTTNAGDTHSINAMSATGVLKLQTHNTDRLVATTTGIGIGTQSPSQLLHIEGSSFPTVLIKGGSSGSVLRLQGANNDSVVFNDNTADKWFLRYQPGVNKIDFLNNGLSSSALTILDSNNYIGIGTSSPSEKLHVNGNIRLSDNNYLVWSGGTRILGQSSYIQIQTGSTDAIRIDSSQRVGIGTTSPYYQTDIRFSNTDTSFSGGSNGNWGSNGLRIENTSSTNGTMSAIHLRNELADIHIAGIRTGSNTADLGIFNEGSEKMRITSSGGVKFGGSSASDVSFEGANTYPDMTLTGGQARIMYNTSAGNFENGILFDNGVIKFMRESSTSNFSFILDANSRISLSNNDSGSSNTIFGFQSGNSLINGSQQNAFYGEDSGLDTTTGTGNVAIGWRSLSENTTGGNNVAVGYYALKGANGSATSSNNVAVGAQSLYNASSGSSNTAVGTQSLKALTTGDNNTSLGYRTLATATTANFNVAIGKDAMEFVPAGQAVANCVAIGIASLKGSSSTTTGINGTVAIGLSSLQNITTGARNIAIGYQSALNNATGADGTFLGYQAGLNVLLNYNTGVGAYTLQKLGTTGGGGAGENNTAIGALAMSGGDDTVANNTAKNNVAVGYASLGGATKSSDGSAFTANSSVAVGYQALTAVTTGSDNTMVGSRAGSSILNSSLNVGIGSDALYSITSGGSNIAIGYSAGFASTDNVKNVLVGYEALTSADSGENSNVAIGYRAGRDINHSSADHNVIIGTNAGIGGTNQFDSNIAIGSNALNSTSNNVMSGAVAIGYNALTSLTNGANNTAIGYEALKSNTTTGGNTAVGYRAGHKATTSGSSTAIGAFSVGGASSNNLTGNNNTGVGRFALADIYDASQSNTAVGNQTLEEVTTGSFNTGLGAYAGDNLTTGAGNTYLGYYALSSANNVTDEILIKAGSGTSMTAGGTETVRIGVQTDFITCDFGENATWSHTSDRRIKKDIKDSELGLDFINDLRPVIYKKKAPSEYPQEFDQYNADKTERSNPNKKHYGFIAQEVKQAMDKAGHSEFPVWKENKDGMQELGETELITPLIKAVQELSAEVKQLKQQLKDK